MQHSKSPDDGFSSREFFVPAPSNTDKIRELERQMATLVERVDTLRRDIDRGDQKVEKVDRALVDVSQGLALLTEQVGRLEKTRDEGQSKRWDLWKLVLAAFLGSILTIGSGLFARWLDRVILTTTHQTGGARPARDPRK